MMLVLESGECSVEEWLLSFRDPTLRSRIMRQIDKLERRNLGRRRGVGEGILELKIDLGPGYRVYFTYMTSEHIILLGCGDKNSQSRDILKAKERWQEYEKNASQVSTLIAWTKEEDFR